jgi:hypothetical protein
MHYSGEGQLLIAISLFVTGIWVESNDEEPQIKRAAYWGCAFIVTGWFVLTLIDRFGALP